MHHEGAVLDRPGEVDGVARVVGGEGRDLAKRIGSKGDERALVHWPPERDGRDLTGRPRAVGAEGHREDAGVLRQITLARDAAGAQVGLGDRRRPAADDRGGNPRRIAGGRTRRTCRRARSGGRVRARTHRASDRQRTSQCADQRDGGDSTCVHAPSSSFRSLRSVSPDSRDLVTNPRAPLATARRPTSTASSVETRTTAGRPDESTRRLETS